MMASLAIHCLAVSAILVAQINHWLTLLFVLMLVGHGCWSYYWLGHPSAEHLVLRGDTLWIQRRGKNYPVHRVGMQWVTTGLIILRLGGIGHFPLTLVFLKDNCDCDQLRRLRVWLQCRSLDKNVLSSKIHRN